MNDDDEWMKLLNGIDLHKLLVESPLKKKLYLCLSEGGDSIIRLAMGKLFTFRLRHFSLNC